LDHTAASRVIVRNDTNYPDAFSNDKSNRTKRPLGGTTLVPWLIGREAGLLIWGLDLNPFGSCVLMTRARQENGAHADAL
jgi:hypothetical protein